MADPKRINTSYWLSVDQLLKFLKGNLLGEKKQEVKDQAQGSPFVAEALDGMKEVKNPEKFETTITELNRQISIKSGQLPTVKTFQPTTPAIKSLSNFPYLSIAASLALLCVVGSLIWFTIYPQGQTSESEIAYLSEDEPLAMPTFKRENSKPQLPSENQNISEETTIEDEKSLDYIETELPPNRRRIQPIIAEDSPKESKSSRSRNTEQETMTATIEKLETYEEENIPEELTRESNTNNFSKSKDSYGYSSDSPGSSSDKQSSSEEDSQYNKATLLLNSEKLDEAESIFKYLSSDRKGKYKEDALWNLSIIYLKKDDQKSAKKVLKKLRSSDKYGKLAAEALDKL